MSKKSKNSSINRNEKLRMILSNNLKYALDIERFISSLNRKAMITITIGCTGIIASCGDKENDFLNWADVSHEIRQVLFEDKEEKFNPLCENLNEMIDNNTINKEQAKKLLNDLYQLFKNSTNSNNENLKKKMIDYIIKSKPESISISDETKIDDKSLSSILQDLMKRLEEPEDPKDTTIKGMNYDELPDWIKEKLMGLTENNEDLSKEFWNYIKNDDKIDELVKNDNELKSRYNRFFDTEKLINEKLKKAGFDEESREKIKVYIEYLDVNGIKLSSNKVTARNYLSDKLNKEKIEDIISGVKNFYNQVVNNNVLNQNIKGQLKTKIKKIFEKPINDPKYKGKIKINDNDISIDDQGKCKITITSNIQDPIKDTYEIELEFFEINDENLKYKEVKDNKEDNKNLSLERLDNKKGNDGERNLDSYEFSNDDKLKLDELITSDIRIKVKRIIEGYKIGDITDYNSLKVEAKKLRDFIVNLVQGKNENG